MLSKTVYTLHIYSENNNKLHVITYIKKSTITSWAPIFSFCQNLKKSCIFCAETLDGTVIFTSERVQKKQNVTGTCDHYSILTLLFDALRI